MRGTLEITTRDQGSKRGGALGEGVTRWKCKSVPSWGFKGKPEAWCGG